MTQKALKLRAEVSIHSVSCPGVFFQCKGPVSQILLSTRLQSPLTSLSMLQVHLSVCFLGFHVKTKPFPPSFPLLFHDRYRSEIFSLISAA